MQEGLWIRIIFQALWWALGFSKNKYDLMELMV